jgi:2,4-dienoyl-CoA reductase-like NADH-dependent reductase (Old Yellow Enzyme family)
VPVIAAGQIRTPEQASRALELGPSLVAVGQGLVINPNWVELSTSGQENLIEAAVRTSNVRRLSFLPSFGASFRLRLAGSKSMMTSQNERKK